LCQVISEVEWSGVLFYTVEGSIKDFDKVKLIVQDVYPMDKGDTASTGYDLGEDFVEYRMDNPETLKWKIGMIHSHHHMKAYFSGVDLSELNDNTEFHNYYLSLVVNNQGALVAKVAFRGDIGGYGCKDEQGENWTLKLSNARQVMFTFDCEIKSPKVLVKVPESFADRTAKIIKDADTKKAIVIKQAQKFPVTKHTYPGFNNQKRMFTQNPFDSLNGHIDDEMTDLEAEMWNNSFQSPEIKSKHEMSYPERYEDFTRYLLRLADDDTPIGDTLDNVLEDVEIMKIKDKNEYVSRVVTMYPAVFEKYWDIFGEINTKAFVSTTSEVLDILEQYEGVHNIVKPLIISLESMITKMEAHG